MGAFVLVANLRISLMTPSACYLNLDLNHSRIKGALLFGAPVTDILAYGGAAIAQRIDQFAPAYSYYFIEARGVGHTICICEPAAFPNPFDDLQQLYFPDMLRFMKATMLDGYSNQIHKVITPLNTSSYDYCDEASVPFGLNVLAETFLLQMGASGEACYNFPPIALTTQPWSGLAYTNCTYPPIYPAPAGLCGLYLKQGAEDPYSSQGMPNAAHCIRENSISSPPFDEGFSIHPNPSSGPWQVVAHQAVQKDLPVAVLNLQGKAVLKTAFPSGSHSMDLDLSGLPAGIYFLHIVQANGQNCIQRLIRE